MSQVELGIAPGSGSLAIGVGVVHPADSVIQAVVPELLDDLGVHLLRPYGRLMQANRRQEMANGLEESPNRREELSNR